MPARRKSENLHQLHGSRPHDRAAEAAEALVAGRPGYPKNLTREAKRIFKMLCRQLENRRALTEGDGHLIQLYAEIFDRRQRAQAKLLAEGEVCAYTRLDPNGVAHKIEKPNHYLKIAETCEKSLISILDRLGLSPLAGTKVKQTRGSEQVEEAVPGTVAYTILQASKETK